MAGNSTLGKAKDARQDEFYTQLSDIENELRYYRRHFRDKVVLCNCDDPYESNFFKYFALNGTPDVFPDYPGYAAYPSSSRRCRMVLHPSDFLSFPPRYHSM